MPVSRAQNSGLACCIVLKPPREKKKQTKQKNMGGCCSADEPYYPPPAPTHFKPPPTQFNPPPISRDDPAYKWVHRVVGQPLPHTAVSGGRDIDGAQIYVGRAYHEGDMIPAKVIPEKDVAYIAHGGQEHAKHSFEVGSYVYEVKLLVWWSLGSGRISREYFL